MEESIVEPDVRVVPLAEHPALAGLVADWHWKEWGGGDRGRSPAQWLDTVRARAEADRVPFTLVALVDGTPAGSVSVCEDDLDERFADRGPWISGMVVVGAARNLGVGRALLGAAEEVARRLGYAELWLHTAEAEAFYRRCGWQLALPKVALRRDAVLWRDLRAGDARGG
jgi:GNAT superfamily N-acetyltransferase